jgi:hypothetical protein
MALEYLTGMENELGKARKKAKKTKAEKKEKRKKVFKKVAKVGLAPARASFLLIVNLNALKLASKLAKLYKVDNQKLINFWTKLGGKTEALKKAIEKGSKVALSGSGDLGVAIEVAIATATPLIIAVVKILKDMKITSPTEEAELDKAIDEGKELLEKSPDIEKGSAEMDSDKDVGITKEEGTSEGGAFGLSTPVLLGIGGAVLVGGYLLLKKKK